MTTKQQFRCYYAALRRQRRRQFYVFKKRERYMFENLDKETAGVGPRVAVMAHVVFAKKSIL